LAVYKSQKYRLLMEKLKQYQVNRENIVANLKEIVACMQKKDEAKKVNYYIHFRMDRKDIEELKEHAREKGISLAQLCRNKLKGFLLRSNRRKKQ
jgi:hypothetical protein